MSETAYRQLFEKYAKRERDRAIMAIVMGTISVAGIALAVRRLRELRADRRTITGAGPGS